MAVDIRHLLANGGYRLPADEQCAELQKYWDGVTAQAEELNGDLGPSEPATTYAAWSPEDD